VLIFATDGIGGATQSFFRLFGDINGDGIVNAADNPYFKQALTMRHSITAKTALSMPRTM
jgi:hypothetical protein